MLLSPFENKAHKVEQQNKQVAKTRLYQLFIIRSYPPREEQIEKPTAVYMKRTKIS